MTIPLIIKLLLNISSLGMELPLRVKYNLISLTNSVLLKQELKINLKPFDSLLQTIKK